MTFPRVSSRKTSWFSKFYVNRLFQGKEVNNYNSNDTMIMMSIGKYFVSILDKSGANRNKQN